jgi:hypothetical protein
LSFLSGQFSFNGQFEIFASLKAFKASSSSTVKGLTGGFPSFKALTKLETICYEAQTNIEDLAPG